jgi:hypothetical protein
VGAAGLGGRAPNLFQPPTNSCAASNGGWNVHSEVQTPTMTATRTFGVSNSLAQRVCEPKRVPPPVGLG